MHYTLREGEKTKEEKTLLLHQGKKAHKLKRGKQSFFFLSPPTSQKEMQIANAEQQPDERAPQCVCTYDALESKKKKKVTRERRRISFKKKKKHLLCINVQRKLWDDLR